MRQFATIALPDGATGSLALKVAVASGPAWRMLVGDPTIQFHDTLGGATIARMAAAEHAAAPGEVLIDAPTAAVLGDAAHIAEWRDDAETGERFAVLSELQIDPIETVQPAIYNLQSEMVRPWLLPAVYARERAGQGEFLTEFRPAVALFLRFVGLDYESDANAGTKLDRFVRLVQAALARYDGALLQLTIGDKGSYCYATFGAPTAHEDDARRAVTAALELRHLAADLGFFAPVQIGISQGTTRAGAYGGATRRTYGVLGDDVNLAARLMQHAAPGEILVSGRVRSSLSADIAFDALPPIRVKGKAEPQPVFTIAGPRQQRAIRLQEPAYALPMVGRADELALIAGQLEHALLSQGRIVGVTAEAGMGKSRLVAEVIRLARRRDLVGYGGSCESYGAHTPYLVWASIWQAFFEVDPAAPLRRQIRALERAVEDLAPERIDALPLLGTALRLSLPDNDFTATLEPQFRQSALHALLLDCLRAAAREAGAEGGGLLFVLEDLHWIDPASYALLELITQSIADLPVLIVLAYRPPHTVDLPHFTPLMLTELALADAEQMIRAKLIQLFPERSESAPAALIERVTARAQGNPFYIEELLNYLHDRAIDPHDVMALAALELPASLHSLVLSRIDQLSTQQQVVLKVASVIGRLFRVAWLHGYYPGLGELGQVKTDLAELARLELTPLDTPEPELAYLFKHIATQEVAYESLAYAMRAALHEQFAAYLERLGGADADRYLDLLAYHYDHSSNLPKKREYLRRAGEAAAARYANVAAVDYLSRALALAPEIDITERYALLLAREKVYDLQAMREAQERDLSALDTLAEALDDARRAEVALRRANYAEVLGDFQPAIDAARLAIALAQASGDTASEAAGNFRWGRALILQSDYDAAREPLQRALEVARASGLPRVEADSLRNLGLIALNRGDYAQTDAYGAQALAIFRAIGDRLGESATLANRGDAAYFQADYATAQAAYEEVLHIRRTVGDRLGESDVLANLGHVARDRGDWTMARDCYEQALAIFQAIGDRWGENATLNGLGNVATAQGNFDDARGYQERSLQICRAIGDRLGESIALLYLGEIAVALGDYAPAQANYMEALRLCREVGDRRNECGALAFLALLFIQVGDHDAAWAHGQQALAIAQEVGARSEAGRALIVLGHALAQRGDLDAAALAYRQALDLRRDIGEHHLVIDTLAGLIRIALQQADMAQVRGYTDDIVAYLQQHPTLEGAVEPFGAYLACYEGLRALHDMSAREVLDAGYAQLQSVASRIGDAEMRGSFLTRVPANHDLAAAWEASRTDGDAPR
jgi:class 3 adenylate cyclase/tetratricopeptide (TPR) repeat protein